MARYRVVIKPSASKEIDEVGQKKDRQRIVLRIQSLGENPGPLGCENLSRQRYRILYSIDDEKLQVDVVEVGHRKDIYR